MRQSRWKTVILGFAWRAVLASAGVDSDNPANALASRFAASRDG